MHSTHDRNYTSAQICHTLLLLNFAHKHRPRIAKKRGHFQAKIFQRTRTNTTEDQNNSTWKKPILIANIERSTIPAYLPGRATTLPR